MARDLIVFGEDWGALPSSTQHLIRHLATERKIAWVNSIGLRQPKLRWHDLQRAWKKLLQFGSRKSAPVEYPGDQFYVVSPMTLPAPRSKFARKLASAFLAHRIKPLLQRENFQSPILWTSLPTAVDMAGLLGESALVYYCGDDFSALAGVDHQTVERRERELLKKSDLVLAASESLAQKLSGKTTRLLPHGVDFELFSAQAKRAHDLPSTGQPIAGFYGSLSEWLDLDLLEAVIAQMPHWQFIFIGKAVIDTKRLQQFRNVHLLGERPHCELPSYSQHWDVSLLPFRDTAQIRACNPLKLREYLAAGKPIVSTGFPALNHYRKFVHQADSASDFVASLEHCKRRPRCAEQITAVADQDWAVRADQLANWLESL